MKKKTIIILLATLVLASVLRIYKLDSAPVSLSWDEAANGYNAWTIANWGKDEYGKFLPSYFKSFGDDKHPVHIYATALSVKLFGLSEFWVRLPAAFFGILNVLLIFFLAKYMFSSEKLGLLASFFLAVSPYGIHFSRFSHEANFILFFFMLALTLFYVSLKKSKYLFLSALAFGVTFITYHPAKIIVPFTLILLTVFYIKKLLKNKRDLLIALTAGAVFFLFVVLNPQLLGTARVNQTSLKKDDIEKTPAFKMTQNFLLGYTNLVATQYSWFFSPGYLFISGDKNPRLSSQTTGEFYKIDALFLIIGFIFLLQKKSKESILLLALALLAPLPSALVKEAPHSARAIFMMGSWHLIAASGLLFLLTFVKKRIFQTSILIISVIVLFFSLSIYLKGYYGTYIENNAIDWQYGMKEIVDFVKDNPQYSQIFTTEARSQPYIFYLFYLKTPLPQYLSSVVYNRGGSKSFNTVSYYDKYYFGGWDPIESPPEAGILYVLTPSEYDGLRFKLSFDVKKVIYYPNGTNAYFIVSAK